VVVAGPIRRAWVHAICGAQLRPAAAEVVRELARTAPIVRQAEDPQRCRCPECLALDIEFPGQGDQLGLFPYVISRPS